MFTREKGEKYAAAGSQMAPKIFAFKSKQRRPKWPSYNCQAGNA
jgi:hypothetical protein